MLTVWGIVAAVVSVPADVWLAMLAYVVVDAIVGNFF